MHLYYVHFGCNMSPILFWEGSGRSSRSVQWSGYLSTHIRRTICPSVVSSRKNKQGSSGYAFVILRWIFQSCPGNSGKTEGNCTCDSMKVCNTPWKYQNQKEENYVAFLLISHALFSLFQEIPHAITSIHTHFHVFKSIVWAFILE